MFNNPFKKSEKIKALEIEAAVKERKDQIEAETNEVRKGISEEEKRFQNTKEEMKQRFMKNIGQEEKIEEVKNKIEEAYKNKSSE